MISETIPLSETNRFSKLFLDYIIADNNYLKSFYDEYPTQGAFEKKILKKKFDSDSREILHNVLLNQYSKIQPSQETKNNIDAILQENTFSITTGHQLNIFTGPLFFIYKIITVINTCKELKKLYPKYNFTPIYWMATEDHDFDEINHLTIENKKYKWNTNQKGAVGNYNLEGLLDIANQIPGIPDYFKRLIEKSSVLSEAHFKYVNEIFSNEGLIILDANHRDLKKQFISVMMDDLYNHNTHRLVKKSASALKELTYNPSVNPRIINLFYLNSQIRSRIEKNNNEYKVLDTNICFNPEEIKNELLNHPERFSPNVLLRPLYQETVLPNLAYVGGPSEISYWLLLKSTFNYYDLDFPILLPRNFATVLQKNTYKKAKKSSLNWEDYFLEYNQVIKKNVQLNTKNELSLDDQKEEVKKIFEQILEQSSSIDRTLEMHIRAKEKQTQNLLDNIVKKFVRAEKKNQNQIVNQMNYVLSKMFPNNSLQEREENFLTYYRTNPNFISDLSTKFSPFEFVFHIISDVE